MASGSLMDCFWRRWMANSLISFFNSITSHELNNARNFFFSVSVIRCHPEVQFQK
jgi:hypothetical protein